MSFHLDSILFVHVFDFKSVKSYGFGFGFGLKKSDSKQDEKSESEKSKTDNSKMNWTIIKYRAPIRDVAKQRHRRIAD